jgi:hypothetical protein
MIWIISSVIAFLVLLALTELFGQKGNYKNDGTKL